jgi:glycosyltransferase involved in cell wall biosynthesis
MINHSFKVVYVPYDSIPSRWANTVQSMKMAQAFSERVKRLEIVTAADRRPVFSNGGVDLKTWYGLRRDIPLLRIPISTKNDNGTEGRWSKWVRRGVALLVASRFPTFVFTRRIEPVPLLLRMGCRVLLENHDPQTAGVLGPEILSDERFLGLVTISEDIVHLYLHYGLPPEKILVEQSGVDLEGFLPEHTKEGARRRLGLALNEALVVYSGHLYDFKGIPIVYELAEKMPARRFVLVGGWDEDVKKLRRLAQERNLPNLKLVGHVSQADLPTYLYAADALLLPPLRNHAWSETTSPLKMFEYMAVRRPIVASSLKNIAMVLHDRVNALLADPDHPESFRQTLEEVLANPALASQISDQAFQDVQRYSFSQRVSRILDFVESRL